MEETTLGTGVGMWFRGTPRDETKTKHELSGFTATLSQPTASSCLRLRCCADAMHHRLAHQPLRHLPPPPPLLLLLLLLPPPLLLLLPPPLLLLPPPPYPLWPAILLPMHIRLLLTRTLLLLLLLLLLLPLLLLLHRRRCRCSLVTVHYAAHDLRPEGMLVTL